MGRKTSWNSLRRLALLAASILSSCFLLTEGQGTSIKVLLQPQHPAEGQDVSLTLTTTPGDAMEKALTCFWYRGLITDRNKLIYTYYIGPNTGMSGDASTGRETVGPGCSLLIRNVTTEDTGNYTVYLTGPGIDAIGQTSMVVSGSSDNPNSGLTPGQIAGIVIGSLAGVALIVGLLYVICTKTSLGRTERHVSNGNVPSAPGHNEGVTDIKPKAAEEDLQYSVLAFKDSNRSPPRPKSEAPPPSDGVTIYSEIKKK